MRVVQTLCARLFSKAGDHLFESFAVELIGQLGLGRQSMIADEGRDSSLYFLYFWRQLEIDLDAPKREEPDAMPRVLASEQNLPEVETVIDLHQLVENPANDE